ncbi:MAG: GNAT family N-acetyltransferase, partial [Anaerolineaceae bacterium]
MDIYLLSDVTDEVVEAFARLFPQLTSLPAPTRAELEETITSPGCRLYMARADGQIAGTATLASYRTPTGLHAWIEDVVVDE